MVLQKVATKYSGSCCPINILPEMQESGLIGEVFVIDLASDSSISTLYFFQREVMEQWSTEISVTQALQKSISLLHKQYIIKNIEEVNRFLSDHKHLLDTLLIIPRQIQQFFGDIPLELQLVKDAEEDYEGLFIIIMSNMPPNESLDHLERMEEEWWLDVDINIKKVIGIDIESL